MAGLMVEEALPLGFRTVFPGGSYLRDAQASLGSGVTVLFERPGAAEGGKQLLTRAVLNGSTRIQEIVLTGRAKGWFKAGDKLVSSNTLLRHSFCQYTWVSGRQTRLTADFSGSH